MTRFRLAATALIVATVCPGDVVRHPLVACAQSRAISYVYDDLSRLIAVIDQQGNGATYSYDELGNLLAIERFALGTIPGAVAITAVLPGRGPTGRSLVIIGKGFSATASQNTVAFSGTAAAVGSATTNSIATTVPAGATSGFITVSTPLGSATSPSPFTVEAALAVAPTATTLFVGASQQFTVSQPGTAAPVVAWSVSGINGGNPTLGTISAEGLYTAPTSLPSPPTVTVAAALTDDPTVTATASVTISPPPRMFLGAHAVTVAFAAALSVDKNVAASVSVVQAAPTEFAASRQVSVTTTPVVTAVMPASSARGTENRPMTFTGAHLSGADALTFLVNNAPDPAITVANVTANADGTQATATVSIAADAVVGDRVVQITTPTGTSTALGTGGNIFTVQ